MKNLSMRLRAIALLPAVALLPIPLWAQPVPASLVLELREDVLVEHARVTLADLAIVPAAAWELGAIPLGSAPRIGYTERFSQVQIQNAIRRHTGETAPLAWKGATAVLVRTRSQIVPEQQIKDVALLAIKSQVDDPAAKVTVDLAVPLPDVEVPVGKVSARARPVSPISHGGRTPVWVDLLVDGAVYRSVVVQLAVSVRRQAYVALHEIVPGDLVGKQDFSLTEIDVANGAVIPPAQALRPFRATRAIRTGEQLTTAAIAATGSVLRGDAVRVRLNSGQIGIETVGVAMDNAIAGQAVSVRTAAGRDLVLGRVSQSGAVILE